MKKGILLTGLALCAATANAQCYKEGYVDWGYSGTGFADAVFNWQNSKQVSADDNFFISRVKPKARFRNAATQVRNFEEANDKKLIAWVPINNPLQNALPDAIYDSEAFNMWSYVTHYGDWTASLGRVPAAFLDVAHKNGVGVSGVAGIPFGGIGGAWNQALSSIAGLNPEQAAAFLRYYGNDGLGYNSEFSGGSFLGKLRDFHAGLVKASKENPVFENFWYDGTSDQGGIMFDMGLGRHNKETFGDGNHIRTSLFFNYNWSSNNGSLLQRSIETAKKINRNSLDLYAGVNMQGGEPKNGINWTLLKDYPISIGLWGAHQKNMFWESRNEQGSEAETQQRTYMKRIERWFTGGTTNPANCPAMKNSLAYQLPNTDFPGMSSMMSARSSLKWDLATEPFITYFNLGNGKFFNWMGVRQNDNEWYNIGIQDYLPTWRYWFTNKLLGKTAADVPAQGLAAEFTWDDAYVGGSCMHIFGSTNDEYLHLFKTEYAMKAGDVITLRYKLVKGAGQANLVLTAKGAEGTAINEDKFNVMTTTTEVDEETWVEKTFTVGEELNGKDLALVALHFTNAKDMDLRLGEFSIVRGTAETPAKPEITSSKALAFHKGGVDGKLIFNMKNDKPAGTPCYNLDVKTSIFKIYAQQEGGKEICMGATTSWAALIYNAPVDFKLASKKVRFGVSAVSLDNKKESEIAWGDYNENVAYAYNDDVKVSKTTIKPNEAFEIGYIDSNHEAGSWKIVDSKGQTAFEGQGVTVQVAEGIKEVGSYDLVVTGKVAGENGTRVDKERRFSSYIQITSESVGALPEIYTLTANDKEANIKVNKNEAVTMAYTGRAADGAGSQAVDLKENRFGAKAKELDICYDKSFTVSAWMKINSLAEGETQILAVADKNDEWPKTDWGWIWSNCDKNGNLTSFTFRGGGYGNNELRYKFENSKLPIGTWFHIAYAFEYKADRTMHCDLYINGIKQECTHWNRTNSEALKDGDPGFQSDIYSITDGMVVSFGGNAFGRAGINGTIDNFMVWNKALTAEEVKTAMGDIKKDQLPASLIAGWDLEDKAADGQFTAVGSKADVKAGLHNYIKVGGEGQGKFEWIKPDFTSGCPFVSGSAFPVKTTPTWKANRGVITDAQGNDKAGSAKVTYAKDGIYDVTLTLANTLGADTKTFKAITVGTGATGIEDATLNGTEVTVENGMALVNFASAGDYNVRVYNAAGQLVASLAQYMTDGQQAQIALGQAGVYVLTVEKDGQQVASVKLLNK